MKIRKYIRSPCCASLISRNYGQFRCSGCQSGKIKTPWDQFPISGDKISTPFKINTSAFVHIICISRNLSDSASLTLQKKIFTVRSMYLFSHKLGKKLIQVYVIRLHFLQMWLLVSTPVKWESQSHHSYFGIFQSCCVQKVKITLLGYIF